jgi:aspartate kinase
MQALDHTLIMKFGGAAVATAAHFAKLAELIAQKQQQYKKIVVVVSAMGESTDHLISLAKEVHPEPPKREYDMLVSVGERISISLLAMALHHKNITAVSFTGSQSGIITCNNHSDAKIIDVRPKRLLPHLEAGKIVIVAGFQGVSLEGEITTLGRGGSDTTAVALGIALQACQVEFFKDVKGLYTHDPKTNKEAAFISTLSHDEAEEVIGRSPQILHLRAVMLAKKHRLPLHLLSFITPEEQGTIISSPLENSLNLTGSLFE